MEAKLLAPYKEHGFIGSGHATESAFGCPRDFLENHFVYVVISPRARGLSVGLNLNPDQVCNFDCIYCEVNRDPARAPQQLDISRMTAELFQTLTEIHTGKLRSRPNYRSLPPELLQLRHVALSGDGEPTLSPSIGEAVETVIHMRALGSFPFFKVVLITNATGLDVPRVQNAIKLLVKEDEIWVKLDAGTQEYMEKINRGQVPIEKVVANILKLGRERPVVVQSLFPLIRGEEPPPTELKAYVQRLAELKEAGAKIQLVQIYSATRPTPHSECGHLKLKRLSQIAQMVRERTGLPAEVF